MIRIFFRKDESVESNSCKSQVSEIFVFLMESSILSQLVLFPWSVLPASGSWCYDRSHSCQLPFILSHVWGMKHVARVLCHTSRGGITAVQHLQIECILVLKFHLGNVTYHLVQILRFGGHFSEIQSSKN